MVQVLLSMTLTRGGGGERRGLCDTIEGFYQNCRGDTKGRQWFVCPLVSRCSVSPDGEETGGRGFNHDPGIYPFVQE